MALFTRKLRDELHSTCDSIRDELDDHREAINEQARDSLEIRDVLSEFDEKIEKLGARIDEIYLLLGADTAVSTREQALASFLQTPRTLAEVAGWLSVSDAGVDRVLRVLTLKGVTVHQYAQGLEVFVTTNSALKGMHSLQSYL